MVGNATQVVFKFWEGYVLPSAAGHGESRIIGSKEYHYKLWLHFCILHYS